MKKSYILAAGLLSILAGACNKDNSTSGDRPLPEVVVSGLQEDYAVFTHKDYLRISPAVQEENRFDFYWTAFTTNFVQGSGLVKPDTLAKTKDLDYEVLLNPGQYILVFNVRDRETGVTKLIDMNLNVSTQNMSGWYLLKDHEGKTDFDFIHSTGRIDNWISFYNEGASLAGNAVKAVFVPSFKMALSSTDLFNTFAVLSDQDAGIYRIDNGTKVLGFDDMFFTKPATHKPQNLLQSMNSNNVRLINDGKAYAMTKGALFSAMPPVNYQLSPVAAVGALDMGFDNNTRSMVLFDGAYFASMGNNAAILKNMHASLEWMTGYAGRRSVALALFRNPQDTGYLIKMDVRYGQLIGSGTLILATDTLPPQHGLMSADAIGGNYDADYIYYALGNRVYLTDVATTTESLQVTLPAGETVTCIQHIKYPQPVSTTVPTTTNVLAIASFANGRYKVWLHAISSTGTIQALSQPDFEGEGRIANITYMEQGQGSRTF
ncbi:PKD-like family lipoprotein [Chitinophaga sp. XS-30]|uniref:PKD-like family lipoprotein n=1 Tax=Chitinophaga sp. XS-30 TaxID=2604421 RepID=UPI0011DD854F|nr:PKD-like family lipoprotein [Chitinophaga sp. XS-30]QEH42485.1 hypothetical protein FW415_17045 [Chitinophaga sp. XS-30]